MADVFGDLSLFSEFEKEREEGSFIHYEEDQVKSRIVFEDYESETECESDDDGNEAIQNKQNENENMLVAENATDPTNLDLTGKAKENDDENKANADDPLKAKSDKSGPGKEDDVTNNSNTEKSNAQKTSPEVPISESSVHTTKLKSNGAKSSNTPFQLSEEDQKKASWLNEQLYADAAEEANKANTSSQQLVYERNKYRRYAHILDSTRCTPDEESPAVQLLFHNNKFALKYRQPIEQFIKGLLWQELQNNSKQDTDSEILVKPGAPTSTDINPKLPPQKRSEHMRQKHAFIGNGQFHRHFLIDFLGWPFAIAEPKRCNINWDIPLYGQVFNEVYADPSVKPVKKAEPAKGKRPKPSCWNCGEENHSVAECRQPRNQANINANRQAFMEAQQTAKSQQTEPKFSGPSRYHLDPELASKVARFKPGHVSEELRTALGLNADQLPLHIYRMREHGYPPGWLAEARQVYSGVSVFDKDGRETSIDGETAEEGEIGESKNKSGGIDLNRIVEYPGFTVPVPPDVKDEHETFKMPAIQDHQLKSTLLLQLAAKNKKKRKRERNQESNGEGSEAKQMKKNDDSIKDREKVEEAKKTETEEGEVKEQKETEEGEVKEQKETEEGEVKKQKETEEGEVKEQMETDEGEVKEQSEEKEVEEQKVTETDEAMEIKEETMEKSPTQEAEASTPSDQSTPSHQGMVRSSSTISLSKDYGTPILIRQKSGLPDPSRFSVGVEEHIPFENLPNAVGTFDKMKGILDLIKRKAKK